MNMNLLPLGLASALVLTGCAPIKPQPNLNVSSPASPSAPEGAYAMASPVLMSGTNYAMAPQPEEQQTPHHEHGADHKPPASQGHEHHDHQSPK